MISIIIPTYNSAEKLRLLLDSIYTSSPIEEKFETIIVDDCSTDNTDAIVKEFPLSIYVKLEKNAGPAFARNVGAKKAKGEILFFTDADTVLLPDTLLSTTKVIMENPEIKCFIGNYEKIPANSGFMPRYKALWEYSEELRFLKSGEDQKYTSFAPRPGIVYKNVFWEIGGFNANFKGADIEDMEFGYRVSKKYDIIFSPDIKIRHHYPETLMKEIKPFAKRCFLYTRLLLSRKKLDRAGESNAVNALADLAGFGCFIAFLSTFIPLNNLISLALFFLFVGLSNNFCKAVLNNENWLFLVKAVWVRFIHTVVMGFSVLFSLLTLPFFKKTI